MKRENDYGANSDIYLRGIGSMSFEQEISNQNGISLSVPTYIAFFCYAILHTAPPSPTMQYPSYWIPYWITLKTYANYDIVNYLRIVGNIQFLIILISHKYYYENRFFLKKPFGYILIILV